MRSIIKLLLCICGIGLLSYPFVYREISLREQAEAMRGYEQVTLHYDEAMVEEAFEKARKYNNSITGTEVEDPFVLGSGSVIPKNYYEILDIDVGIMGTLEIPCIDIKLPIYHGVDETVLKKGVGHLKESPFPIGGEGMHSILTAHRGLPEAKLFSDLDKVKIGDEFYIRIFDRVFAYEVDQINVVEPSNMENLRPQDGEDLVTLVTCTPYGVNSHRLLVRGARILYEEEETAEAVEIVETVETVDRLEQIQILYAAGAVFVMIALIFVFIVIIFKRRKRKELCNEVERKNSKIS